MIYLLKAAPSQSERAIFSECHESRYLKPLLRRYPVRQFLVGSRFPPHLAVGGEPGCAPTGGRTGRPTHRPDKTAVHGDSGREKVF